MRFKITSDINNTKESFLKKAIIFAFLLLSHNFFFPPSVKAQSKKEISICLCAQKKQASNETTDRYHFLLEQRLRIHVAAMKMIFSSDTYLQSLFKEYEQTKNNALFY